MDNKAAKRDNDTEVHIRETLATIRYMLKNTDNCTRAKIKDIEDYIYNTYDKKFKTKRDRISKILEILNEDYIKDETKKLGFTIDFSSTKSFIDYRGFNEEEYACLSEVINTYVGAQNKDTCNGILDKLKEIFLCEKKSNSHIKTSLRGKAFEIFQKLCESMHKRIYVKVILSKISGGALVYNPDTDTTGGTGEKDVIGIVTRIDKYSENGYIVELANGEDKNAVIINSKNIKDVIINRRENHFSINSTVNLNEPNKGYSFMVAEVDGKPVGHNSGFNRNCCIIDGHEKEREMFANVGFTSSNIKTIKSFYELFPSAKKGNRYIDIQINPKDLPMKVTSYEIDINRFIEWVVLPNNFIHIYDIEPKEILVRIFNYANIIKNLMASDLVEYDSRHSEKNNNYKRIDIYRPEGCKIKEIPEIEEIIYKDGRSIKYELKNLLVHLGFDDAYLNQLYFANLNPDSNIYWSNPRAYKVDNNVDDAFYLVLHDRNVRSVYVFRLRYIDLNNEPTRKDKNGVERYNIKIVVNEQGHFINKASNRDYTNDLVQIIMY